MPNPSNSNPGQLPPGDSRPSAGRQETLLLSDVPNTTILTQEMAQAPASTPSLSTNALAALSQRYDILSEAGHGAMGNVYKARDRETGEIVALKLLKPEIASDQVMIERFKNELLFARKITHKNVCRVHEFNRIGGIAFTSMEFVEGESLRSVLNRFGGFPPRKGIDIALQICSGLKEAHAQGIVHRDLKPENVMIDSNGNVKIMDFGIARSMESLTKLTGAMIGTPAYMAPEQVAGKPVDYRTDIYSLGLMLYEMFTGSQAFQAETAVALALKQMREAPPLPHDVEPNIPAVVERAILKCLEKEPGKRFQSVAELESVLSAKGVTGTTGFTPAAVLPVRSNPTPVRVTPISMAPKIVEPRRSSHLGWILFGLFAAIAILGSLRANKIWTTAEKIASPDEMPAPQPPPNASDKVFLPAVVAKPAAAKPAPKRAVIKSPAEIAKSEKAETPAPQASAQAQPANAQPANVQPARNLSLFAQQQRSEKILSQQGSANNAGAATFLWVGRYGKEDSAQKAVRKLKGLSQNAFVVTKHFGSADFYAVFVGPVGAKNASDTSEWLESQGFRNVHAVKNPYAAAKPEKDSDE